MKKYAYCALALLPLTASCAGARHNGTQHTVHAEAFHFLGITIPSDENPRAWEMVPEGAEVTTVRSSPSDWTSVLGVISNLFGISYTEISYEAPEVPAAK